MVLSTSLFYNLEPVGSEIIMYFRSLLSLLFLSLPAAGHQSFRPRSLQDVCIIGDSIRGPQEDDWFGYRVSINSDGSVVSAGAEDYNGAAGFRTGLVQVLQYDNNVWSPLGSNREGINEWDNLRANALSDDGKILAVGASPALDGIGYVQVYELIDGEWSQRGNTLVGPAAGSDFGSSVALSGNGAILAVGAPISAVGNSGQVHIFEWNEQEQAWMAKGDPLDGSSSFGWSISLSQDGSVLAVGSIFGNNNYGKVQVFKFANNNWGQLGQELLGTASGDQYGRSVSLSSEGSTVAFGAIYGSSGGQVKVYQLVDNNGAVLWSQLGQTLDGDAPFDNFGTSVSLSGDASILAASAPYAGSGQRGLLRLFQLDGASWQQIGNDIYGSLADDEFGQAVAVSRDGSTVIVGASAGDTGLPGYLVVYSLNETCLPAQVTPAPVTPSPVTPVPVTPAPVTPAPETATPIMPSPVTPAPVMQPTDQPTSESTRAVVVWLMAGTTGMLAWLLLLL